jgi:hypothetical protein
MEELYNAKQNQLKKIIDKSLNNLKEFKEMVNYFLIH